MKKPTDDWGTALGEDPDRTETPAPKKNTLASLVYFFQSNLPTESFDRIGAPVNGKALMFAFKKLVERGFTHDQIRDMIMAFVKEIARRPLPVHVAPWRGFIANMDKYAKEAHVKQVEEPTEPSVDPRLSEL